MSSRERSFLALMAVFGFIGAVFVMVEFPSLGSLSTLTALLVAAGLMSLLDVALPMGDFIEIGTSLVLATLLISGPLAAVVVSLVAAIVATIYRNDIASGIGTMLRRVVVSSYVGVLFAMLAPNWRFGSAAGFSVSYYLTATTVATAFLLLDLFLAQAWSSVRFSQSLSSLVAGNVRLQGWMYAAEGSVSLLALLVYPIMGVSGLVIVVVLLVVMRQSFALFIEVRQAYRSTIESLVKAVETQHPETAGHAQRVADLSAAIAKELGFGFAQTERVTYAALLHEVGTRGNGKGGTESVSPILSDVRFLAGVVPVLTAYQRIIWNVTEENSVADSTEAGLVIVVAHALEDGRMVGARHTPATLACLIPPNVDVHMRDRVLQAACRTARVA